MKWRSLEMKSFMPKCTREIIVEKFYMLCIYMYRINLVQTDNNSWNGLGSTYIHTYFYIQNILSTISNPMWLDPKLRRNHLWVYMCVCVYEYEWICKCFCVYACVCMSRSISQHVWIWLRAVVGICLCILNWYINFPNIITLSMIPWWLWNCICIRFTRTEATKIDRQNRIIVQRDTCWTR